MTASFQKTGTRSNSGNRTIESFLRLKIRFVIYLQKKSCAGDHIEGANLPTSVRLVMNKITKL